MRRPSIMKGILRSLLVLTLMTVAAEAQAAQPMLWHGTRYGMSTKAVRHVLPHVVLTLHPSHLGDGSLELLHLDHIRIAQNDFTALFYFTDGKLTQVTLTVTKKNFDELMPLYETIMDALRSKYGRELSYTVQRELLNRADATWMHGRTNINVLAMSVGQHEAQMNINYQLRVAQDADNL